MDKEKEQEGFNIMSISILNIHLTNIIMQLKDLGISSNTLSVLSQGLMMSCDEMEKKSRDFQFKQIIDPLENKEKKSGEQNSN